MLAALVGPAKDARADDDPLPAAPPEPTADPPAPPPEPAIAPIIDPPSPPSSAPTLVPAGPTRVALRYDLRIDVPVTAGLAALLITWVVAIKPSLSAPTCTICDGDNGKVNALDDAFRSLRWSPNSAAAPISDVLAYGVAPAVGVASAILGPAYDHRISEAPVDMLVVLEAGLTFAVLQQGITVILPRERPSVHAQLGADHASSVMRHSALESFPAGHPGSAFAIAAASGTVASMRHYRLAPLIWVVGNAIATFTSYLRIAADKHYFTDAVSGSLLGIGTGIAVPLLFHYPVEDGITDTSSAAVRVLRQARISTTEVQGGRIASASWAF